MRQEFYQHINANEQTFVDKLLDMVDRLEQQYSYQLTDFLDPRQQDIAHSVLTRLGIAYYSSQAMYPLEQARLILAPDYYQLSPDDFEMALVEITYQAKFSQVTHSQILGTLLNGLGLKRQVIGDILVAEGQAQIVLERQMADYVLANTAKIARTGVTLRLVEFTEMLQPIEETQEDLLLTSSLRLDKIVALLTKQSRSQAQTLIINGRVKVNHREVTKPTHELLQGDLLSIRGYGRYRLGDCIGKTKTDKYKLMIEKTIK